MSPELEKVAERAGRDPSARFHSLAHLLNPEALARAYHRMRANAAVGVDGVDKESYGRNLADNLRDLHERLRDKRYRHQPIRRVYIPKDNGELRPLGISAFEDKVVQDAVREVLAAVYEQDFTDYSYGFRPGRSAHDALRTLTATARRNGMNWVVEADIRGFFDAVSHRHLLEMIRTRIPDGSLLRLVGKCLRAGVLDGEELTTPDMGTPQGSVLSPLLANIYLHYVLDVWFRDEIQPRMRGRAVLVRYADDFVICFTHEEDARRVLDVLPKRMARYGLTLHPDKTRRLDFRRPPAEQTGGKGPETFDFLGFTLYWKRSAGGKWAMACKTRGARVRRALVRINEYCRDHRHDCLREQHEGLCRKLLGHFNYFGVNGNIHALRAVRDKARRYWHYWLYRRSQRAPSSWERFSAMLRRFPLPRGRVVVRIWAP